VSFRLFVNEDIITGKVQKYHRRIDKIEYDDGIKGRHC
jgi:hypothetical protein